MNKKFSTKRALVASVLMLALCFSMLVGTTFAWFTDSVTSGGNVIQTGKLDVAMYWAEGDEDPTAVTTWTDASKGAIFKNEKWEPGYAEAKHIKIANEGTLALNYQVRIVANGVVSKLADVIDVYVISGNDVKALTRADLAGKTPIGTVTEVLGTAKNLSNAINGSIKAGEDDEVYTIVLKMQESAGNEYQEMDLGCTFSVELLATQMADESDSFGNDYDSNTNGVVVPNESVPAALVRKLDKLNINSVMGIGGSDKEIELNAGYKFEPTVLSAEDSIYRYWHADFVVKADKDVPANSVALAGYYKAWCEAIGNKWVALTADVDINADTEIRLVEQIGATVNWEEICKYGNDGNGFQCGVADVSGTGVNAGTTITVELRLYETTRAWDATSGTANSETGEYITVGEFEYTFGGQKIDTEDELKAAMTTGGTYELAKDLKFDANNTITVPAGVTTVLDMNGYEITATANKTGNQELFLVKGDLTVKNGSMEMTALNNQGWGSMATIFDVTAGGALTMEEVTANISGTDMNFIVHLNNWGSATLNVNNCDFTATYVAIRAFNSGYDMNTVTIKNTDFHTGRMFWVHNYTSEGANDSTLTLDIYGNNNTCDHATPVRFGFSNSVYYDMDGNAI